MLNAARLAMALILIAAAPALAGEQDMIAENDGQIVFATPSGNIGCIYTPEGGTATYEPTDGGPELSCDRVEPSYVNVLMGPAGEPVRTDDPGEQGCCGIDQVLAYGNTAHLAGFVCIAETSGLTCERDGEDTGFLISKAKIQIW